MNATPLKLRAATFHDIDALVELSHSEFGGDDDLPAILANLVRNWPSSKTPLIAARRADGLVVGFAYAKPNESQHGPRMLGQVAILAQVAVADSSRGEGVGRLLVERAAKTMQMLGFSTLIAQHGPELESWYGSLGWSSLPIGDSLAWVEPVTAEDDEWFPELPLGSFSPLLLMDYADGYPQLSQVKLRESEPIVSATFRCVNSSARNAQSATAAIMKALDRDPELKPRIPSALLEMMTR